MAALYRGATPSNKPLERPGVNSCAEVTAASAGRSDDVDATFAAWTARGVTFGHYPQKSCWGYGAELVDADGYLIRLWDEHSMKAH